MKKPAKEAKKNVGIKLYPPMIADIKGAVKRNKPMIQSFNQYIEIAVKKMLNAERGMK